jgi:hypothetical protein
MPGCLDALTAFDHPDRCAPSRRMVIIHSGKRMMDLSQQILTNAKEALKGRVSS